MEQSLNTSVLIVGAGPAGLSMALDLGWRGIDCIVIDEQDGTITLPRAATITARTMEFCRRWGIWEKVAAAGFPQDYKLDIVYCTSLAGHLLEREPYPALADRKPPPYAPVERHRCPQKYFNPVLAGAAKQYAGVSLHYLCKLESFEESEGGITAHVRELDAKHRYDFSGDNVKEDVFIGAPRQAAKKRFKINARYMVACDGVDSGIRRALGIGLDGTAVIKNGYSVSLLIKSPWLQRYHDKGEAERYMFIGPEGVWGNLTVVDGREEWRLSLTGFDEKIDLAKLDKDAIVRRCMGSDKIPYQIMGWSTWRRREVVAERMRKGRVFLAGDCVHSMSPTGGFGMNTSLGDTVDLGWKLEAVLRGWAPESLLDSYEIERKPVGLRFALAGTALFKPWLLKLDYSKILEDSPAGEKTRKEVGTTLKEVMYPEWETWGTAMGYKYEDSPLCIPDGTPAPPDDPVVYIQTARPGSRAPHAWLKDGRSTLDLFGKGFVLLRFGAQNVEALTAAAARVGMPLTVVDVDQPEIAAIYERGLCLVRPDGHTAWRGDEPPEDAKALIDTVRGAFVRRETAVPAAMN